MLVTISTMLGWTHVVVHSLTLWSRQHPEHVSFTLRSSTAVNGSLHLPCCIWHSPFSFALINWHALSTSCGWNHAGIGLFHLAYSSRSSFVLSYVSKLQPVEGWVIFLWWTPHFALHSSVDAHLVASTFWLLWPLQFLPRICLFFLES